MSASFNQSDSQILAVSSQEVMPSSDTMREEEFLRLHLVPNTSILLPIQQLVEVLKIPTDAVVPIPHLPTWVMGVYNWRGEILWVVDLGHLCGLTPWYQQASNVSIHSAVILQAGARNASSLSKGKTLGLVVHRVEDIEWCSTDLIQSLPSFSINAQMERLLRGYWWKSHDDMLAILDGESIFNVMPA
jgi:positive phototaxis protein PixI